MGYNDMNRMLLDAALTSMLTPPKLDGRFLTNFGADEIEVYRRAIIVDEHVNENRRYNLFVHDFATARNGQHLPDHYALYVMYHDNVDSRDLSVFWHTHEKIRKQLKASGKYKGY